MNNHLLRPFQIYYRGERVGPPLVTTREFGRWMHAAFAEKYPDVYTAATMINNAEGRTLHPGAFLNRFFRNYPMQSEEKQQRSFKSDSQVVLYLFKHDLANYVDADKLAGSPDSSKVWVKAYTVSQIIVAVNQLFAQHNKRLMSINDYIGKAVVINCTIKPHWEYDQTGKGPPKGAKSLFEIAPKPAPKKPINKAVLANKGLARISIRDNYKDEINLYKINTDGRGWDYVYLSVRSNPDTLVICQGTKDWHSAKLDPTKSKFSYRLGELNKFYPKLTTGKYKMKYFPDKGEYHIYLEEKVK